MRSLAAPFLSHTNDGKAEAMARLVITRTKRKRIVRTALAVLLVGVVALNALGGGSRTTAASATSPLPLSSFELFGGGEASFADFDGKPLVINFWASWCPACVAELPEFQAVHEQYSGDVTILGLANSDRRDSALDLAAEVGLTYELGDDPQGDLFRSLELIAMPSTLFITADGQVHEVFGGQLNEAALAERIDNLIGAS